MKGKENMFTKEKIMSHLTGGEILDCVLEVLKADFEDFPEVQNQYAAAMERLREALGNTPCDEEERNISRQLNCRLLFSGFLGLKANLDNFRDPVTKDFLDADPEVYLREQTACRLPEYENLQKNRCAFYCRLSAEQQRMYEAVIGYTSYLETEGPKLAHYYGYILGNDLLPLLIPGYHPDAVQTARYKALLYKAGSGFLPFDS